MVVNISAPPHSKQVIPPVGRVHFRRRQRCQQYTDDDFDEPYIAVTVKDNGTGIPPELLPYVFERGVTGANSTGMGLAISKKTIETHGGEISVRSVSGVGCEVTFTIPIYNEAGRSPNGELLAHATGERQEDGDV